MYTVGRPGGDCQYEPNTAPRALVATRSFIIHCRLLQCGRQMGAFLGAYGNKDFTAP